MTPIADLSLSPLGGAVPSSRVQRGAGQWTVPGCVLEGAWDLDGDLLVATTDDVPFEDMLHLSLLSGGGAAEHLTLGGAYTTGSFREIGAGPDRLRFRFLGETEWCLTVLRRPAPHLPFVSDPRGVSRPFTLRTRLRIGGRPQPAR